MAADNLDPFSQFGQLSLDPNNRQPMAPAPAAPAPGTPPNAPKPGSTNPTMTGGYQYSGQQPMQHHQPTQVTPEHPANSAMQQQGQMQQMQPVAYSNYQHTEYAQPPQPLQPGMQPHQQSGSMTMPSNHNQPLAHPITSPPISPLWTPASPQQSPPDGSGFAPNATGGAPVPALSPGPAANPFDMFAAAPPVSAVPADPFGDGAPLAPVPPPQIVQQDDADFWNDMGFGNAPPAAADNNNNDPVSVGDVSQSDASLSTADSGGHAAPGAYLRDDAGGHPSLMGGGGPVPLDDRGLPAGGEYYKARVTTAMLGAIFSSAKELRSTLYKTASDSFVEAIGERPVISFTIDGSAADTAGIGLGHVLMKVNDQEVGQTDQAVKTVGAASRPMIMEFYIPNKEVKVVKTEGQCMVKYDNHSTEAPASACEWKPKYVVVGDMLGKPHILYMYRSKAEYDIAVKESQTRNRALSVKVKQFDIRGAKIFHERGTVQYPNKSKWCYFTVVRGTGLPIKISASTPEALYPVYEGIVGFLDKELRMKKMRMEQNRERMQMSGMYRETYY